MYKFIHKHFLYNSITILIMSMQFITRTSQMKNQLYIPVLTDYKDPLSIEELKYGNINEIKDNKCTAFKRINKKYLISQVIWFLQIKVLFFFVFFYLVIFYPSRWT